MSRVSTVPGFVSGMSGFVEIGAEQLVVFLDTRAQEQWPPAMQPKAKS